MGALLGHLPAIQDIDIIGPSNGGQAVRDDNQCAGLGQTVDAPPDLLLAFQVYAGGGLVKHDIFRLAQQSPSDPDLLPLAAREFLARVAHVGVQP